MTIFQQTFSAAQICAGARIPRETLQNWMKRKLIVGHGDTGPDEFSPGSGNRRRYSFFNLMEISVAAPLADHGLPLDQVFAAAREFAHTGSGHSHPSVADVPERLPGLPYHYNQGKTFVLAGGGKTKVVLSPDGLIRLADAPQPVFTTLDATELFRAVLGRLEMGSFGATLDAEYAVS